MAALGEAQEVGSGTVLMAERVVRGRPEDELLLADEFGGSQSGGFAPCGEVIEIDIRGDVAAAAEGVELVCWDGGVAEIATG